MYTKELLIRNKPIAYSHVWFTYQLAPVMEEILVKSVVDEKLKRPCSEGPTGTRSSPPYPPFCASQGP